MDCELWDVLTMEAVTDGVGNNDEMQSIHFGRSFSEIGKRLALEIAKSLAANRDEPFSLFLNSWCDSNTAR